MVSDLLACRGATSRIESYKGAIFNETVGNGTSGFTRCADQENLGLRHVG
jgi:hypothetical protein